MVVTIISPSSILSNSSMSKTILTLPEAIPGLAPRPFTRTFPKSDDSSPVSSATSPNVVIGLACNKNKLSRSNAHSVSIGSP